MKEINLPQRSKKTRENGLTSVIDTGIPLRLMEDQLSLMANFCDIWKFGFASTLLYDSAKIRFKRRYNL